MHGGTLDPRIALRIICFEFGRWRADIPAPGDVKHAVKNDGLGV
jgi:hypothetical protein